MRAGGDDPAILVVSRPLSEMMADTLRRASAAQLVRGTTSRSDPCYIPCGRGLQATHHYQPDVWATRLTTPGPHHADARLVRGSAIALGPPTVGSTPAAARLTRGPQAVASIVMHAGTLASVKPQNVHTQPDGWSFTQRVP